jgi:hypothetical protein
MMDIMRSAFGDDRIKGSKFPQEERKKNENQQEEETDSHYGIRSYMMAKAKENQPEDADRYEDMNPNGFWECQYSVQGIKYNFGDREDLKAMEAGNLKEAKIVKVVSQGLMASDPKYLDKVVYMIRHPRSVAKSQERLKRGFDTKFPDGKVRNIFEGLQIHTPEMYIGVTVQASRWILGNPDVDIHFVHFEDLLADPEKVIKEIGEFLTVGDFSKALGVVEKKLNRSKHQDIDNNLWEDSEFVYDKFVAKEYQEILDYFGDPKREYNREKRSWYCPRYGQQVTQKQCHLCRTDKVVRENFKTFAMQTMKDWQNEPCFFESGMDLDREEYLTIEESVKQNFWVEDLWLGVNDAHLEN